MASSGDTYFADILQNGDDETQIPNVKYRQWKPDIAKVSVAVLE
jgi:hypothetical protein